MRWIVLGPPGSGKGTQAKRLAAARKASHLSTGDMLRAEVARGTAIGREAKAFMERGELVPDDLIIRMIRSRLQGGNGKGFILDGFPRTRIQAEELDQMLEEIRVRIDRVVLVRVGDEEIKKRLASRAVLEGRPDDTEDVILRRLDIYREQTEPVVAYYRDDGRLAEVEGEQTIDQVYRDLEKLATA